MLGGDRKLDFDIGSVLIALQKVCILLIDLTGILQELPAVIGQRHAFASTVENRNVQRLLQLLQGTGQRRL